MPDRLSKPTQNEVYYWFASASLISIVAIGLVVLVGQMGLSRLITPMAPLTASIQAASSQIARAQKIGILAADLAAAKRPGKLYTYRTEIAAELNEFVAVHRGLLYGDVRRRLTTSRSDTVEMLLLDSRNGLDRFARDFEDQVRREFLSDSLTVEPELAEKLKQVVQRSLAPRLTELTNQLSSEVRLGVSRINAAQISLVAVAVLTMLVLGGLVYRPLARKVASSLALEAEGKDQSSLRYDEVTGLANRTHLLAFMAELCKFSKQHKFNSAVLNIEVGGTDTVRKSLQVNDVDEMMSMIARRIESACRSGDFIARVGDDEFVVVLTSLEDNNSLNDITNALRTKLSLPFVLATHSFSLKSKIGIKIAEPKDQIPATILNQAATALKISKASDNYDIQFFSGSLAGKASEREREFQSIEKALKNGEFTAYFQPIVGAKTGELHGVEALVRWQNAKKGILTPIHFMETIENRGLSNDLTRAVLAESLRALRNWKSMSIEVPYISINMTAQQLLDRTFIDEVKWIADSYEQEPSSIALEFSEKAFSESDSPLAIENLQKLADYGFKIFLQDFGALGREVRSFGKNHPQTIKIERAFVSNIDSEKLQHDTLARLIDKAHKVKAMVIASGVETHAERTMLQQLGADAIQGYLIAEPSDADTTADWLLSATAPPANHAISA